MNTSVAELEKEALHRLREKFETEGYRFLLNPTRDDLPEFLQEQRPDALAIGPSETVVIEAKRRRTKASDILLAHLTQEISSRPGWRLLVIYAGEDPVDIMQLRRAERSQIDLAIKDARALRAQGHNRYAIVAAWSLFEALARHLYESDENFISRALSPMQIVERLASEGHLNLNEAQRLRSMISTRNRAVHGDLAVDVPDADVDFMLNKAAELNRTLDD